MAFGLDISWSRVAWGLKWLDGNEASARLFVGDLFAIPFEDESIDIVYTHHSIEPNGGREKEAIQELLRVASRYVVLVEPIYELASREAQDRMRSHGYVQNLKETAETLGAKVNEYRLLDYVDNPLNPTGLVLIEKTGSAIEKANDLSPKWRCPVTCTPLQDMGNVFVSKSGGLAYPVLRGIPLLRPQHSVVASAM